MELAITIIGIILGSSGLFAFLTFLITRRDNAKKEIKTLNGKIDNIEQCLIEERLNSTRVQMLIMMNHYKKDKHQIMQLAERYFKDLHGDFYMTSLFAEWLNKNNIEKPLWFDEKK